MLDSIARLCIWTATVIGFARSAWVVMGFLRTLLRRRSLVVTRWGWVEYLVLPEPFVLGGVTYALMANELPAASLPASQEAMAVAAGVLAVGGVALTLWAGVSLPSVGSGHYVIDGQPIVERGPYGWLRHPFYLAAFMIWLGVAAAYSSLLALVVFGLYVVPAYVLYIREEEGLMIERYGDAYRDYRRRVGGLVPRRR